MASTNDAHEAGDALLDDDGVAAMVANDAMYGDAESDLQTVVRMDNANFDVALGAVQQLASDYRGKLFYVYAGDRSAAGELVGVVHVAEWKRARRPHPARVFGHFDGGTGNNRVFGSLVHFARIFRDLVDALGAITIYAEDAE